MRISPPIALCAILAASLSGCGMREETVLDRANQLFAAKQFRDAELQYRKLLGQNPKHAEAHYRLALTYLEMANPDQAYESLQKAVALQPDHEPALTKLAGMLLTAYWSDTQRPQPLYTQLQRLSAQLLTANPGSAEGHRVAGYLSLADHKPAQAAGSFRKALQSDPASADSAALLVQSLFRSGNAAEGNRIALEFLNQHPGEALVYEALYRERKTAGEDAVAILNSWVAARPREAGGYLALANHHRTRRDPAATQAALDQLIANVPEGRLAAGDFYQQHGEWDRALEFFRAGSGLVYQKRQIALHFASNQISQADAVLDTAWKSAPADPDLRLWRAVRNQSLEELRALAAETRPSAQLHYEMGRILARKGNAAEARKEWKQAVRLNPRDLEPRFALARLALDRREFSQALDEADAILDLAPGNEAGLLSRMSALRAAGRLEEARAVLLELRARNPKSAALDLETAYLRIAEGKNAEAERLFRALYRPGLENVRVVAGFVEALSLQGKLAEALDVLEADRKAAPGRPIVMYALGTVYSRRGDWKNAETVFRGLIELDPSLVAAHTGLAENLIAAGKPEEALAGLSKAPAEAAVFAVRAEALERLGRDVEAEAA
ncbi:MAG: tetratricopeptide repeat protein, partial [Bryobacterales bacterium]|nr:tetratricopeptide repeat protein [Bryobacterales bacterium]